MNLFKNGISLIKFTDEFISEKRFVRILDNKKYCFDNGKKILFTKEIKTKFIMNSLKTEHLVLFNINETSDFLNKLDSNDNYIVSIEFIAEISVYDTNGPRMILSKDFVINKFSSEKTLTKFINERLDLMVDYYYLDDTIIQDTKEGGGPMVLLNYTKFYFY